MEQKTKKELVDSALYNKSQAVSEYKKEMESLRAGYKQSLQDKVVQLEEAYKIARKLGIQKPAITNLTGTVESSGFDENLLYMRGYDVLDAEIEALKTRKSIDPFISTIRPIQEKLSYLGSIEYDIGQLKIISVDAWAEVSERSIKPKKALVLVLAGLLGGMLGVFVSLILWAISKRQNTT